MEHIAADLQLDPLSVRLVNMIKNDNPLPEMIKDLKIKAGYDIRRKVVDDFNSVSEPITYLLLFVTSLPIAIIF
jgi:hypothetical protein